MALDDGVFLAPADAGGPRGVLWRVLELRYGLDGGPPQSVEQTSRVLRIHRDFIRSMEAVALSLLSAPERARLPGAV
jgi:DNA-directed RNA polymerase sigma subunit (sigma70/sigma32)